MRQGVYDAEFILLDGQFVGVNLGWDYCAEHECGIRGIRSAFQMVDGDLSPKLQRELHLADNPHAFGIARRIVRAFPESLIFAKVTRTRPVLYTLFLSPLYAKQFKETNELTKETIPFNSAPSNKGLSAAWDEHEFAIVADNKYKEQLEELYEAFKQNDVCIYLGKYLPFTNPGLHIMIASRLPTDVLQEMWNIDEDAWELQCAAEATGIIQFLKAKGKSWYCLEPRWKNKDRKEFWFWLNPMDQHRYNYGFYTVEELRLWGEDKGPIVR